MESRFVAKAREFNAAHATASMYLEGIGMHLSTRGNDGRFAIFTNGDPAYSRLMGYINNKLDIASIEWE